MSEGVSVAIPKPSGVFGRVRYWIGRAFGKNYKDLNESEKKFLLAKKQKVLSEEVQIVERVDHLPTYWNNLSTKEKFKYLEEMMVEDEIKDYIREEGGEGV